MDRNLLSQKAEEYLIHLCHRIPNRRVGAEGNRMATAFLAETLSRYGFEVETPEFACLDWADRGAHLLAGSEVFEVFSSPYTLGCQVEAPLAVVRTVEELEAYQGKGEILLLCGEIAKEQLMPKNFPFFNPEEHQRIVRLLEQKAPLAVIGATGQNLDLAGGMYPFPLFEDGDFDIPAAYMKDVDGEQLAGFAGQKVSLTIDSERIPSTGTNVIARKPAREGPRMIVTAHIDAKDNTPGALDNGTGVVLLMLLAELLENYAGPVQVELLTMNGEDHYSAQGHKEYLKAAMPTFDEILLAVNIDLAGLVNAKTAFSLYSCPEEIAATIRTTMSKFESIVEGEQWYQSDHSVFIQNGRPAAAITSDRWPDFTHTPEDDLHQVDYARVAEIALALRAVVDELNCL